MKFSMLETFDKILLMSLTLVYIYNAITTGVLSSFFILILLCYNNLMNLTSPTIIKELLAKYETYASKGLGQNFLIDKNVLRKIVLAGDIAPTDIILEVGPGLGVLTQELAPLAKKIIAVEKSASMQNILKETLADYKNIEIIDADILTLNPESYILNPYKVIANIPYYLTSPLIRKFLEIETPPQEIVLMIQKEVAQRICAPVGKMSLLAVSVQFYADVKIVSYVSKNCFWPAPKIDSAIIKIIPHKPFDSAQGKKQISHDLFFEIVKAGFSQPRKQLGGNFSKFFPPKADQPGAEKLKKEGIESWLLKNNIKPTQRAQTLSIQDWINLTQTFYI